MVKIKVIPKTQEITIHVPISYIGKEVEIIAFSKSELVDSKEIAPNGAKLMKYVGIISSERAEEMQTYLKEARSEWDRDIF